MKPLKKFCLLLLVDSRSLDVKVLFVGVEVLPHFLYDHDSVSEGFFWMLLLDELDFVRLKQLVSYLVRMKWLD